MRMQTVGIPCLLSLFVAVLIPAFIFVWAIPAELLPFLAYNRSGVVDVELVVVVWCWLVWW